MNGQKLISVSLRQRGARTWFQFDLGAELETKPFDRTSEQGLLYEPGGYVLSFRADRRYNYAPGNAEPGKARWRSVSGRG